MRLFGDTSVDAGHDQLRGRTSERATIDALLAHARGGRGDALLLTGEPGIGKTALLEYAAKKASGFRVLRVAGVAARQHHDYEALHQLVRPLFHVLEDLPAGSASTLRTAVQGRSGQVSDLLELGLAMTSLFAEAARHQPVLYLIDDAQWIDTPSLRVVSFLGRRIETSAIVLALAARSSQKPAITPTRIREMRLRGLPHGEAQKLLAEHCPTALPATLREEVLAVSAGNPLALRTLPTTATSMPRRPGYPLRLVPELQAAFRHSLHELGHTGQQFLLLVSATSSCQLDVLHRAASELRLDSEAFESPELQDFIQVADFHVSFRQPLMRSAVYHGATDSARRAAHRALAAALTDSPDTIRRAWHLAQISDEPDEHLAAELERSMGGASHTNGHIPRAVALEQAVAMSGGDAARARRYTAAAETAWRGGDPIRALRALNAAIDLGSRDAEVTLDIAKLRAWIALRAGKPAVAVEMLCDAYSTAIDTVPGRAVDLVLMASEACFEAGTDWSHERPAPPANLGGTEPLTRLYRASCQAALGAPFTFHSDDYLALGELGDPQRLCWAGAMANAIGDVKAARLLHWTAVQRARASAEHSLVATALDYLVTDDLERGRFARAETHAVEGSRLASETGQPNVGCWHAGSLAVLAALRGDEEAARQRADEVLAEAKKRNLRRPMARARRALGLLALAAGQYEQALDHFLTIERRIEDLWSFRATVPDLVEAAAHLGANAQVIALASRLRDWAQTTSSPEGLAAAARCDALLNMDDLETALRNFEQAIALYGQCGHVLQQARTRLLLGEALRRAKQRSKAGRYLWEAFDAFTNLGMSQWAHRAQDELRAAGKASVGRLNSAAAAPDMPTVSPATLQPNLTENDDQHHQPSKNGRQLLESTTLTPQEQRIAMAVGNGATNREIAAKLFLSPRTIDYHLRKIFQKLGISSRVDLVRMRAASQNGMPRHWNG